MKPGIQSNVAARFAACAWAVAAPLAIANPTSVNPGSHPVSYRHQLIACMTREMSASRTISYNEATRVCKTRLAAPAPVLASSVAEKSVTGLDR